MDENKFYLLLDKVFSLMLNNRLREDIDDTVLEKLLSIIKTNYTNDSFINDLLKNTKVLILCEKALSDLLPKEKKELSISVVAFALRFLGFLLENQTIFISRKSSSIFNFLSSAISNKPFSTQPPSVQDALLSVFISISKHQEGALWIIELGLIDSLFSSISSSSYYVRKTAVNFFSTLLHLWSSAEFLQILSTMQRRVFSDAVRKIISMIISIISIVENLYKEVGNSCILILKQLHVSLNLYSHVQLIDIITKYFENSSKTDICNQDIIDLLIIILQREDSNLSIVRRIVQLLVTRKMFVPAFHIVSSFLRSSEENKSISCHKLSFILMPLDVISGKTPLNNHESLFCSSSEITYLSLQQEMSVKSNAISLLCLSLRALAKLANLMNEEAIKMVLLSFRHIFQPLPDTSHFPFSCLESKTVCLAFLELFESFLKEKVYTIMDDSDQRMLFEYLIQFLQKTSIDTVVVSKALNHLKSSVALNTQPIVAFGNSDELIKLLCRKLFDSKESIVDSALHLAGEMMNGKDCDLWRTAVLSNSVHLIIWDIAIEGCHDGVIKSSALKVIVEASLQTQYLNDIKSSKSIGEMDIMNVLCNYIHDADFFMAREAVLCAFKWIDANRNFIPSWKDNLFLILSKVVRSLDLDMKLIALDQWKYCIENTSYFPTITRENIDSCFTLYCDSGLGASLMYSLEDYDEAVKYKAGNIILDLRTKFLKLGLKKEFFPLNDTIAEKHLKTTIPLESTVICITKEEQNQGIESVLKLSTTQQLLDICKISDFPEHYNYTNSSFNSLELESFSCSVVSFWECMWSDKLDTLLSLDESSPMVFSDYTVSLLDDIIAAEKSCDFDSLEDTPDCY